MGVVDAVFKSLSSSVSSMFAGQTGVVKSVLDMIQDPQQGGLKGFLEKFRSQGMGEAVASWVSSGPNQAITPEQLNNALGEDRVAKIAGQLGMTNDELATKLAEIVPTVVDRMTPGGNLPEEATPAEVG